MAEADEQGWRYSDAGWMKKPGAMFDGQAV